MSDEQDGQPSWAERPWEQEQVARVAPAKPSTFDSWVRGPKAWAGAGVLFLLIVVGGVWAISAGGDAASQAPTKYTQTWTTPYAQTTCADWTSRMTSQQRFAAAADMLLGVRTKDGDARLPADSMVNEFVGGMTTACVIPTMSITDAAIALYITEPTRFGP